MSKREQDHNVNNGSYLVVASIIVLLSILVTTIVNLNNFSNNRIEKAETPLKKSMLQTEEESNPTCLVIGEKDKDYPMGVIKDSLKKLRVGFIYIENTDDMQGIDLKRINIIIISGEFAENENRIKTILGWLGEGKHIIFTSIPKTSMFQGEFRKAFGVKTITEPELQKGVRFLPGFMLGGELKLSDLQYESPQIQLLSTAKTYALGAKDSAVIWRNTYSSGEVYAVCGPFLHTKAAYGLLAAIMGQIHTDYIYPVINAKAFTYVGLPSLNNDSPERLKGIYNRNSRQLQKDILIPDILSITKSRNLVPSSFLISDFGKENNIGDPHNIDKLNWRESDFSKLGEDIGLVYTGDLENDLVHYSNIMGGKTPQSLSLRQADTNTLNELKTHKMDYSFLQCITGPWMEDENNFGFVNDNTVYIPFTMSSTIKGDEDILEFYSYVTAFGVIVQNLDFERVMVPKEDKDNWIYVSKDYIKLIDSYRNKFKMINSKDMLETAQSVKIYNFAKPEIQYEDDKIKLNFNKRYGESFYFLRSSRVDNIIGGSMEKVEEGVYLITAKDKEVVINLHQIDRYK